MRGPVKRHQERCREVREQLSDYLDGELAEGGKAVERHLRWCPSCGRMLSGLKRTVAGLGRLGDRERGGD